MYGICIIVTKLVHNLGYPVVVVGSKSIPDDCFESGGVPDQYSVVFKLVVQVLGVFDEVDERLQPLQEARHGMGCATDEFMRVKGG